MNPDAFWRPRLPVPLSIEIIRAQFSFPRRAYESNATVLLRFHSCKSDCIIQPHDLHAPAMCMERRLVRLFRSLGLAEGYIVRLFPGADSSGLRTSSTFVVHRMHLAKVFASSTTSASLRSLSERASDSSSDSSSMKFGTSLADEMPCSGRPCFDERAAQRRSSETTKFKANVPGFSVLEQCGRAGFVWLSSNWFPIGNMDAGIPHRDDRVPSLICSRLCSPNNVSIYDVEILVGYKSTIIL
ncbi:hypothetical protein BDZ97DRAFT_453583 [Flammula alnicola]|nr:hypothetical protein BDZ97DRAFT_453583 [Flammula alnicola]